MKQSRAELAFQGSNLLMTDFDERRRRAASEKE
jgi:hypothetical protein